MKEVFVISKFYATSKLYYSEEESRHSRIEFSILRHARKYDTYEDAEKVLKGQWSRYDSITDDEPDYLFPEGFYQIEKLFVIA